MEPRPGCPLIELHQNFAFLEPPEKRRHRPDIERKGGNIQKMVQDPRDFGKQYPDILTACRHFDPQQFFGRQGEGVLLTHRRDVIQPVEIRHGLKICLVLDQFLGAAMQQTDMGIRTLDDLPVHFQHQPQHAMRSRMLRAEIHRHILDFGDRHQLLPPAPSSAFSSPGRMYSPPSQGLMKSKLRKAWVSLTGS